MRRTILSVLLVIGGIFAANALGDATQTRPDAPRPGLLTEIVVDVDVHRYRQGEATAAYALWATCAATASNRLSAPIEEVEPGRFRLVVEPALGDHARERVVGCLRDLTIDRVRGHVISVREVAARAPRG